MTTLHTSDANNNNLSKYEPLWGVWYSEAVLGEGSFGKVYKVRRQDFGRTYYSAVKMISIPRNEAEIQQLRRGGLDESAVRGYLHAMAADILSEIDVMSQFRGNSHIVSIEDYQIIEKTDTVGWDILIRMELLTSLAEYTHQTPLTHDEVVRMAFHISRALELCAQKNVIHRDIKPGNIFVSEYGDYKLGDFGIARRIEGTMSGLSKKGTSGYVAPEVFRGNPYGADVDTYSLGIVMYRLLNQDRLPFLPGFPEPIMPRDQSIAVQRRMSGETVPDLKEVSSELNTLVKKACSFERHERFATPTEMREALEAVARSEGYNLKRVAIRREGTEQTKSEYADSTRHLLSSPYVPPNVKTSQDISLIQTDISERSVVHPGDHAPTVPANEIAQNDPSEKSGVESFQVKSKTRRKVVISCFAVLAVMIVAVASWFAYSTVYNRNQIEVGIDEPSGEPFDDSQEELPAEGAETPASTGPSLTFRQQGINNEKLASMVKSGEIPSDVYALNLNNNNISDLTPLQTLSNLTVLYLEQNNLKDLTSLQSLTGLRTLSLRGCGITNITPLKSLTQLEWLNLDSNNISDLIPLGLLTNIKTLFLEDNDIKDLMPLRSLINLEDLYLSHNKITDLMPLKLLTNLNLLRLGYNNINDLSPLESLISIEILGLHGNRIIDIDPIKSLTGLKNLNLYENLIQNFSPLASLRNLQFLYLDRVSDITPLKTLSNLEDLLVDGLAPEKKVELQAALPNCTIQSELTYSL